jgi:hypothetical protein
MHLFFWVFINEVYSSSLGNLLQKNGWELQKNIENENLMDIRARRTGDGFEESFNEVGSKKISPNSYSYSVSSSYGSTSNNLLI